MRVVHSLLPHRNTTFNFEIDTLGMHTSPAQSKTLEVPRETRIDAGEGVVEVRTVPNNATFQATCTQQVSRIDDIDATVAVSGEEKPNEIVVDVRTHGQPEHSDQEYLRQGATGKFTTQQRIQSGEPGGVHKAPRRDDGR